MIVLRIESDRFVAQLVHDGRNVQRAAPIIRYMVGWSVPRAQAYCERRGWQVVRLHPK